MFSSKNDNDDAAESVYSKFEEVKNQNLTDEVLDKSGNAINLDDVNLFD